MSDAAVSTESKHPAIRDELRRRICREGISGRLPSIRALADEFGVHNITAGKAVDALVEEGLVRSVPRKGHFVVRRKVREITMLVYSSSLEGGFYGDLARILVDAMPRYHLKHEICLAGSGTSGEGFPAPGELSAARGTAILTVGLQDRNYILSVMDAGFPVVALDYVPTDPAITAVGVDGLAAGSEAARCLIARGARDVLYMGHGRRGRTEVDALMLEVGYRVAMEDAGLEPRSCFARGSDPEHGARAFQEALEAGAKPDGVFTSNPETMKGIWKYCEREGIRPPEHQITLDFLVELPGMTTVRIDMQRFCETALDLLRQTADAPGLGPRQVLVRTRIDEPGS